MLVAFFFSMNSEDDVTLQSFQGYLLYLILDQRLTDDRIMLKSYGQSNHQILWRQSSVLEARVHVGAEGLRRGDRSCRGFSEERHLKRGEVLLRENRPEAFCNSFFLGHVCFSGLFSQCWRLFFG